MVFTAESPAGRVYLKVVRNECCLCITMDQLTCISLSHTHNYWYEVGMLKVSVVMLSLSPREIPKKVYAVNCYLYSYHQ